MSFFICLFIYFRNKRQYSSMFSVCACEVASVVSNSATPWTVALQAPWDSPMFSIECYYFYKHCSGKMKF